MVLNNGLRFGLNAQKNEVYITGHIDENVKEVIIPSEINGYPVKKIDFGAFRNCRDLQNIVIPNSIKIIGDKAFYNCKSLTELIIPNNIMYISEAAFENCTNIKKITIGASITYVFFLKYIKNSLESIEVDVENKNYFSIDGVLFGFSECNTTTLVQYPLDKKSKNYTVPVLIDRVKKDAFEGARYLENIYFKNDDIKWIN